MDYSSLSLVSMRGSRLSLRTIFGIALLTTTSLTSSGIIGGVAYAQSSSVNSMQKSFNIRAQSLTEALMQYGKQSGLQVSSGTGLVEGLTSSALSGNYTSSDALNRLLASTGLTYQISGSTVTLHVAKNDDNSVRRLDAISVESQSDAATTEGTGSYTTGSMASATGFNLSIRETPQSISILSRQQMDDYGIVSLHDAISNISGLNSVQGNYTGNSASFMARGFAIESISVDGMALGISGSGSYNGTTADMSIYDRVEVLRGANGLMQGSGSPSASVNLIRKKPTEERQVIVGASIGSWNNFRLDADVGGTLNEGGSIRGRLVAAIEDSDSFIDVLNTKTHLTYGVVEVDLAENTMFTFGGSWRDSNSTGTNNGLPSNVDGSALHLPRSTYLGTDFDHEDTVNRGAFTELKHDFSSGWQLTVAAQTQSMDADFVETTAWRSSTDEVRVAPSAYDYHNHNKNASIRATGPFSLFGRDHELVVGANLSHQVFSGAGGWDSGTWSDTGGVAQDPLNWDPSAQSLGVIDRTMWIWDFKRREIGFHSAVKLNPIDDVSVIIGGRINYYKRWSTKDVEGFSLNGNFTPYAGITWGFESNHSLYASFTQIFEPQSALDKNGDQLPPVTGSNYEAGIKGEYFDGKLNLNASLFLIRQRNRPVNDLTSTNPCPGTTYGYCKRASGEVESKGFEVELSGQLTDDWNIIAGYSYTDAKYINDQDASLIGQRFDSSMPKHQINISTNYNFSGTLEGWNIGGSLRYQSWMGQGAWGGYYNYLEPQPAYAVLGLFAGYRIDEIWRVTVNVNNILDKNYYTGLGWGESSRNYGTPRNVMFRIKGNF
ncbi:MAG: TonB-dependent siderophore receptor [Emcibacteraceae bacterium]|nr:TonB-dependent siderophore receptor [Emcibacteraceae bacterium]